MLSADDDGAGKRIELDRPVDFSNGVRDLFARARGQEVTVLAQQPVGDVDNLVDGLPGAEEDFGKALAETPVAVQRGEAQLLIRQKLQPVYRLFGGELPLSYRLQDFSHLCSIHAHVPSTLMEG